MNDNDIPHPERTKRYEPAADDSPKVMVGFKVVQKQYSQVRAIFAELGQSDTVLLRALSHGHGITFNTPRLSHSASNSAIRPRYAHPPCPASLITYRKT